MGSWFQTWHIVLPEVGTLVPKHVTDTSLKDKAVPLHAWTGPEGSRRLKIPDFETVGT
jgi:hypothetical protein